MSDVAMSCVADAICRQEENIESLSRPYPWLRFHAQGKYNRFCNHNPLGVQPAPLGQGLCLVKRSCITPWSLSFCYLPCTHLLTKNDPAAYVSSLHTLVSSMFHR
jgi:hypothetical protein